MVWVGRRLLKLEPFAESSERLLRGEAKRTATSAEGLGFIAISG